MVSFRSLALLGLTAAVASAQSTLIPTATGGAVAPTASPAGVPGWQYIGCAAPPSLFSLTASEVFRGPENDAETCSSLCGGSAFFFLVGPSCHCTNALANGTNFVSQGECTTTCPGNPAEICGRSPATAPLSRRQALLGAARISVYRQLIIPAGLVFVDVNVLAYVDINTTNITDNINIVDNSINNSNNNNNIIIGNNNIIGNDNVGNNNNVYIDLPLVTKTYCETTTRTGCGCDTTYTVPVQTKTIICYQCGPEATTITITIPTALPTWLPTATATPSGLPVTKTTRTIQPIVPTGVTASPVAPVFTGGAVANGVSGGLALVAGALALL